MQYRQYTRCYFICGRRRLAIIIIIIAILLLLYYHCVQTFRQKGEGKIPLGIYTRRWNAVIKCILNN